MLTSLALLWQLLHPHLKAQRLLLVAALLLTAAAIAIGLVAPLTVRRIIDTDIPRGDMRRFGASVAQAMAAYGVAYVLWAAQQSLAALASERLFLDVKRTLLARLLAQPRVFFDRLSDAEIALRLNTHLPGALATFRDDLIAGVVELLFILGLLVAVVATHAPTGLFLALAMGVYVAIVIAVDRPLRLRALQAREARSAQNALFLDILAGVRDIRLFGQQRQVQVAFDTAASQVAGRQAYLARFSAVLRNGFALLGMVLALAPVAVGGWVIIKGGTGMSVGLLVALVTLVALLVATLNLLLARVGRLIEAEPSLNRVAELMQPPPAEVPLPQAVDDIPDTPRLAFEAVDYARPDGTPLLRGFSLCVEAGEKVALMGASGSGKSSVLDLLMRMRAPVAGRVLYSGIDVRAIAPALYYSAFGFVGEGVHMMRGSLRDFLMQGWPGQTDADLWRVLARIGLDSLVRGLPQQLDSPVGWPGRWTFSGGQRVRLAVARALLRDPQVLILDEIAAGLYEADALTLVRDVLATSPQCTVLCTTHSPQVAALFDRTVVLQS